MSEHDKPSVAGLTQLGAQSEIPTDPLSAKLEVIPAPYTFGINSYVARFTAPEFTSLCPKTGQPDFAHLVMDYIPDAHLIESKSLKLFLFSFRNYGSFHEHCTMLIADRLVEAIKPHWFRMSAFWYPRGGIPIDIFWQTGTPPQGVYIPSVDVPPYRGRG
jgi:7-cyano-7-deazaguanine reductase